MLGRRTDLALEAKAIWEEGARGGELKGVTTRETEREGFAVTRVDIVDEQGARALGKPQGAYVTVELDGLERREQDAFGRAARAVAAELSALLKLKPGESVLVVGLGNRAITPDAVGPLAADHTLVTRHLVERAPEHFGSFRPVASLAAEVLGNTGMESGEVARAVCEDIHPACVIAVDALASRSLDRLCRTVQLADTGITPGSGIGNHRFGLNRESLGVPVSAVGVPTVVDGATLAADLMGTEDLPPLGKGGSLLVTPKDIDSQVSDLSHIIGYGISLALQPGLTVEDLDLLLN